MKKPTLWFVLVATLGAAEDMVAIERVIVEEGLLQRYPVRTLEPSSPAARGRR